LNGTKCKTKNGRKLVSGYFTDFLTKKAPKRSYNLKKKPSCKLQVYLSPVEGKSADVFKKLRENTCDLLIQKKMD